MPIATYFRVYRRPLEVVNIGLTWEAQPKDRQTCREDSHNRTFRGHMRVCSDTTECFGVRMKCLKTSVLVREVHAVLYCLCKQKAVIDLAAIKVAIALRLPKYVSIMLSHAMVE